jgi:hypothetical protein
MWRGIGEKDNEHSICSDRRDEKTAQLKGARVSKGGKRYEREESGMQMHGRQENPP